MRTQWLLLVGFIFAIIVAVVAVVNVEAVPMNYVFGSVELPLILIILGSAFLGAVASGSVALARGYKLQNEVKSLKGEVSEKESQIAKKQKNITDYQRDGMVMGDTEKETRINSEPVMEEVDYDQRRDAH